MSRVWVSFWDAALDDEALNAAQRARYERWRGATAGARRTGAGPRRTAGRGAREDMAVEVAAFAHGLVVQALFDPERLPAARQLKLLDDFLSGLAGRR